MIWGPQTQGPSLGNPWYALGSLRMASGGVKRQRSDGFDYEAVLLDIEGTTTPISFVKVTNLEIER